MNHTTRKPELLGIVGTGLMGRGIAQIAVQGGIPVILHDSLPGGAEQAREAIIATLDKLAAKGKLAIAEARGAAERLTVATLLSDLAPCSAVVEAIVERLDVKRELFQQLEAVRCQRLYPRDQHVITFGHRHRRRMRGIRGALRASISSARCH